MRIISWQRAGSVGLLMGLALAVVCCGKADSEGEDERSDFDPALAAIEVDAATVSDADGVVTVTIDSKVPNTQIVRASESSRIKGASLAFPPGSFDINFDVSLEEGRNIATKANLTKLLDENAALLASSSAVVVTWTYDEDSFVPFKITIPVPTAPSPLPDGASLVILMLTNQVEKTTHLLRLLPASAATVTGGFVTFESQAYGAFQAVYINRIPTQASEVETADKQQSIGKITGVPPAAFTILGPTRTPMVNAGDYVNWEVSDLADTYTLKFDHTAATCPAPYKTADSIKSLSLSVKDLEDGQTYVCVSAVNTSGVTPATNTGFSFSLDRSLPPVPAKPTTNGPVTTSIEAKFEWVAVTDVGPSGVAYYQLEVGTTPGGADIFNGPVVGTSKGILGFHGKTYYARVSAVDNAGNQSEFSPVSEGVEIDSE